VEDSLLIFVIAVYGLAVAFVQERVGKFEDLSPTQKQSINAFLAFVVPLVVNYVVPFWRPELGEPNAFFTALGLLLAPVFIWLVSQVGHQFDRILQTSGGTRLETRKAAK